tara:strand:- start:95 stop:271 length:177 start_codon:yes stop_codon:yes gene_type:complete
MEMKNKIKVGDLVHLRSFGINGMVVGRNQNGSLKINLFGSGKNISMRTSALTHLKGGK